MSQTRQNRRTGVGTRIEPMGDCIFRLIRRCGRAIPKHIMSRHYETYQIALMRCTRSGRISEAHPRVSVVGSVWPEQSLYTFSSSPTRIRQNPYPL